MTSSRTAGRSALRIGAAGLLCGASAIGLLALSPSSAQAAAPRISVSEVAPWASGNSPYKADWFELTNNGSASVAITGWKIDDDSNSFAAAVALTGVPSIGPGESVVFIETTSAATVAGFKDFWFPGGTTPAGLQIGTYSGSGVGLSTSGDAVNIFDAGGIVQAAVTFGANAGPEPFSTFDNTSGVDGRLTTMSTAGVHGASRVCRTDGTGAIGSPGTTVNGATPGNVTCAGSPTPTPTATPTTAGPQSLPWPGGPDLKTVDNTNLATSNLSGLIYTGSGASGRIYAVDNGPSTLDKLVFDGTHWVPDTSNGSPGTFSLKYPDGTGDPDSEGVTIGGPTPASGIFVSTERDNDKGSVSNLSVLRYDDSATTPTLSATARWDLTPAIPATSDPNKGLEAIAWIPDSYLTANGLRDSSTGTAYNPTTYADHGTGLFFVGVEDTGTIYGFALDQGGTTYHLVTSFPGGFSTIMEATFEPDAGVLWAHCDNTCSNASTILTISKATGTFAVAAVFDKPAGMPATMNNEGYAISPNSECVNGLKPVYFADDGDTDGYSLRQGSLTCGALVPAASLPEFPVPALAPLAALLVVGAGWRLRRRRATA